MFDRFIDETVLKHFANNTKQLFPLIFNGIQKGHLDEKMTPRMSHFVLSRSVALLFFPSWSFVRPITVIFTEYTQLVYRISSHLLNEICFICTNFFCLFGFVVYSSAHRWEQCNLNVYLMLSVSWELGLWWVSMWKHDLFLLFLEFYQRLNRYVDEVCNQRNWIIWDMKGNHKFSIQDMWWYEHRFCIQFLSRAKQEKKIRERAESNQKVREASYPEINKYRTTTTTTKRQSLSTKFR